MKEIKVWKVVLNMGVGEGGDKLAKAESVLEKIAGQKPARTYAKGTIRDWGVKKGGPIGCKVTIRGRRAEETLNKLFDAIERRVKKNSFDGQGNFSFGIKEHIDVPGISYDPAIGIFGMDVCVSLYRPGYRVKWRRRAPRRISSSHLISREEAVDFITRKFGVEMI
jgi:large subunit ribosomal protein L5